MQKTIIVVSSITGAARGKEILERYGMKATITRTPQLQSRYGCGYALELQYVTSDPAMLLREYGVRVLAVL